MKLLDILARELKVWPEGLECLSQIKGTGYIINGKGFDGRAFDALRIADETLVAGAIVTRAEWQAAVDALNAPKVVEWDGVGSPQPGCSIEYSIGDGWYPCEVRYVLNRDDCPGIALIAWCEHLGKDQYLSNDRDHRFRPARTAEQVAAEEREKGIQEICATLGWLNIRSDGSAQEAAILYDAGYRKEPKPCGS